MPESQPSVCAHCSAAHRYQITNERDCKRFVQTGATAMYHVDADRALGSRFFGSQILVFHFPGMIERVKGGVPYQVPQRPLTGQFTL
jgi:hypothetical protein